MTMMATDRVFRVEDAGPYFEKMRKLMGKRNLPEYPLHIENDDLGAAALSYAKSNRNIVSIELLGSGYNNVVGFVMAAEDG